MTTEEFQADRHLVTTLRLLATSLPEAADEAHFRWKHLENPSGPSHILLALEGGQAIGVRIFMRWTFFREGRVVAALRPVDTATHPRARGRGVFTHLTRACIERYADGKLIFNTPNEQSLPGDLKLGWVASPGRIHYRYRPRPLFSPFSVGGTPVEISDRCPDVPDHEYLPACLTTHRTEAFIRWRYRHPTYRFARLQGRALLVFDLEVRAGIRTLRVLDFVGSRADYPALVAATARRLGAWVIREIDSGGAGGWLPSGIRRGSSLVVTRYPAGLDGAATDLHFSAGDLQSVL
jgi:GNAT superfamily N-acetyltransferase